MLHFQGYAFVSCWSCSLPGDLGLFAVPFPAPAPKGTERIPKCCGEREMVLQTRVSSPRHPPGVGTTLGKSEEMGEEMGKLQTGAAGGDYLDPVAVGSEPGTGGCRVAVGTQDSPRTHRGAGLRLGGHLGCQQGLDPSMGTAPCDRSLQSRAGPSYTRLAKLQDQGIRGSGIKDQGIRDWRIRDLLPLPCSFSLGLSHPACHTASVSHSQCHTARLSPPSLPGSMQEGLVSFPAGEGDGALLWMQGEFLRLKCSILLQRASSIIH